MKYIFCGVIVGFLMLSNLTGFRKVCCNIKEQSSNKDSCIECKLNKKKIASTINSNSFSNNEIKPNISYLTFFGERTFQNICSFSNCDLGICVPVKLQVSNHWVM